ncbi:hypothetical protein ZIOFF_007948 [Zingiber officinale]|uniref:Reverse transcriptase zinc-binding domain-containing protein n=1 Tax=Zingiber officinale TaxID=94328 RepID=A0A8J5HRL6_ZINOF|nr:hypothetical protein ZIOFF_007948 [Zingiber officinale]
MHLTSSEDMARVWIKGVRFIGGVPLRIFKCTPYFSYTVGSSVVPVWIHFPDLPLHMFSKAMLFSGASIIGKPIKIDEATADCLRLSVARVCVEIDLLKPKIEDFWIGIGEEKRLQRVEFEKHPSNCVQCLHLGHSVEECYASGNNGKSAGWGPALPHWDLNLVALDGNVQRVEKQVWIQKKGGKKVVEQAVVDVDSGCRGDMGELEGKHELVEKMLDVEEQELDELDAHLVAVLDPAPAVNQINTLKAGIRRDKGKTVVGFSVKEACQQVVQDNRGSSLVQNQKVPILKETTGSKLATQVLYGKGHIVINPGHKEMDDNSISRTEAYNAAVGSGIFDMAGVNPKDEVERNDISKSFEDEDDSDYGEAVDSQRSSSFPLASNVKDPLWKTSTMYKPPGVSRMVTRSKAQCDRVDRRKLWDDVLAVKPEMDEIWLVAGLLDVGFVGDRFLWTNGKVWKRLDRVLVSTYWGDQKHMVEGTFEIVECGGMDIIPQLVSLEENQVLSALPSIEELKRVVWEISEDSAAGPDGFSAAFYVACWDIIKEDLHQAILEFFQGGSLPKGMAATTIVLIPKVDIAQCWQEFRPISLCGLGIRRLSDAAMAFTLKFWFRFREQKSFWAIYMSKLYCGGASPCVVPLKRNASPCWRRLVKLRNYGENNIGWIIGNGEINFWYDNWLDSGPLHLFCPIVGNPDSRVVDFICNLGWNVNELQSCVPEQIVDEIKEVALPGGISGEAENVEQAVQNGVRDCIVWKPSLNGKFTMKTAWKGIWKDQQQAGVGQQQAVWRAVWSKLIFPNISIFVWRFLRKRLPVDEVLQRRGVYLASKCYCCDFVESWNHLSGRSWSYGGHVREAIPFLIIWFLWCARNDAKHRGIRMVAKKIIWNVSQYIISSIAAGIIKPWHWKGFIMVARNLGLLVKPRTVNTISVVTWKKPKVGWFKLNADGCSKGNPDRICYNHEIDKELRGICNLDKSGLPYIRFSSKPCWNFLWNSFGSDGFFALVYFSLEVFKKVMCFAVGCCLPASFKEKLVKVCWL